MYKLKRKLQKKFMKINIIRRNIELGIEWKFLYYIVLLATEVPTFPRLNTTVLCPWMLAIKRLWLTGRQDPSNPLLQSPSTCLSSL